MNILLTNDDGIVAEGLKALKSELKKIANVTVCAPSRQKSAISHAITLYRPLVVTSSEKNGVMSYAVDGTPADCVKLAMLELVKKVDLVVSGINRGLNTGSNVLYSGTIAAALEASLLNIPSCAVSLEDSERSNFKIAARIARGLIDKVYKKFNETNFVFNINIPAREKMQGVRITTQEAIPYEDKYERRIDPRGRVYYWLRGNPERRFNKRHFRDNHKGLVSDAMAVRLGYVSITPLKRDLTNYDALKELESYIKLK